MSNNFFFENRTIYKVMWKNVVDPDRIQMAVRPIRFACWITKATNVHPEYVILIAFPLQRWLQELASNVTLCVHCLSCYVYC
jgi:hypothetical protein